MQWIETRLGPIRPALNWKLKISATMEYIMENTEPSQRKIKELIKNNLGEVPLTAELYWLVRSRGKGFHSRFSLENLDKNIPTITEYLKEHPLRI